MRIFFSARCRGSAGLFAADREVSRGGGSVPLKTASQRGLSALQGAAATLSEGWMGGCEPPQLGTEVDTGFVIAATAGSEDDDDDDCYDYAD